MKKKVKKSKKHTEGRRFRKMKKKTSKKSKKKKAKKKIYRRGALGRACFAFFDKVGVDPVVGKEDAHFNGCVRAAKTAKPDSTFGRAYYSWMRNHYRNEYDLPSKAEAKKAKAKAKVSKKTSKKKKKAKRAR